MRSSNRKLIQKSIAVIVIVALLQLVGVSAMMMLFATGIVFLVWMVNHRSQTRELEQIFSFYVSADAILREDERRWYAFEVAEVIEDGERALDYIPDCPALHLFALGALYHRIGKYEVTAEYLGRVLEDDHYDERQNSAPSQQLRRYVMMLRRLEANPALAPQKLAAIRSLERLRRKQAARLLDESRALVKTPASETPTEREPSQIPAESYVPQGALPLARARPPISEVLHDVYQDDPSTLN
ncbi:MAG TPA: hypothetical protein VLA93_01410 [Pyrinomonadaceae bacterium]|nr:hypothetical protein [Pyrinomonadaceae bacterium]